MARWTALRIARVGLALVLAAGAIGSASAQWAWKDDNGRMVYSDSPPPSGIRAGQIVRQPSVAAPAPTTAPAGTPPAANPATSSVNPEPGGPGSPAAAARGGATDIREPTTRPAPKSLADQEQEFRKRQQARAEAEKKAAEEESKSAQMAKDCERAQGYIRSLESGIRINRTDAGGNPHFLDENERAAELERARSNASSVCH
ncbi:MAG TPA: DUF4124 domain-containing protein [Burkholderiaceae bacterium]|nr:DUF4124 domain-containing protein [Burkholderiaceae bacterium]